MALSFLYIIDVFDLDRTVVLGCVPGEDLAARHGGCSPPLCLESIARKLNDAAHQPRAGMLPRNSLGVGV